MWFNINAQQENDIIFVNCFAFDTNNSGMAEIFKGLFHIHKNMIFLGLAFHIGDLEVCSIVHSVSDIQYSVSCLDALVSEVHQSEPAAFLFRWPLVRPLLCHPRSQSSYMFAGSVVSNFVEIFFLEFSYGRQSHGSNFDGEFEFVVSHALAWPRTWGYIFAHSFRYHVYCFLPVSPQFFRPPTFR